MNTKTRWYLGNLKDNDGKRERVYLEDFKWECDWYWGGGCVTTRHMHTHFDGCFLEVPDIRGHPLGNFVTPWTKLEDYRKKSEKIMSNGCAVWEPLGFFLDNPKYTERQWWRIKDLFKQFYAIKAAAECFQHGGHCTQDARSEWEINKEMAAKLNAHIETVIIPEIRKALDSKADKAE